jgi:hypothetical protein
MIGFWAAMGFRSSIEAASRTYINFAAKNWLYLSSICGLIKLNRPMHYSVIGHRDSRLAEKLYLLH